MANRVFIRVLFFGMLRDLTGLPEERLEVESGTTVGGVFAQYSERFPRLGEMSRSIVLAANEQFAAPDHVLSDEDEVAFLPPVSGGAGPWTRVVEEEAGHFFALTHEPIDTTALTRRLAQGIDGAIVTFEGIVRNNSNGRDTLFLDYECYEGMAIQVMARIGREVAARHEISRIGMVHRLGRMEIGEASVAIAVASPHRQAAFDAAREAIDRLKKLVPIWKKEHFTDGEVWVEGAWDSSVTAL